MNIIYLDTLFFINWVTDYFALLSTGKICGTPLCRVKIALSAAMGGLYACLSLMPPLLWLRHPLVKLVFAVVLCLIAYGGEARLLRICLCFLTVSAAFGGILTALSSGNGDMMYLPMDFKALLLTFAVAYCILSTLYRRMGCDHSRQLHRVTVRFLGTSVSFTALRDTGNQLYDPISNRAVLVCPYKVLTPLFPYENLQACQTDPFGLFEALGSTQRLTGKMRLIPFHSVGGHGMLIGFQPDDVEIDGASRKMVVAMTDKALSNDDTYQGIF